MKCPKCKDRSEVLQTMPNGEGTNRRRRCLNPKCGYRFTTNESDLGYLQKRKKASSPEWLTTMLKKKNGKNPKFDADAIEAAIRTDQRRSELRRAEKYNRNRIEYGDDAFDPAPSHLDHESLRREIDGY